MDFSGFSYILDRDPSTTGIFFRDLRHRGRIGCPDKENDPITYLCINFESDNDYKMSLCINIASLACESDPSTKVEFSTLKSG